MVLGSPLLSYLSNNIFHGRKPVLIAGTAVGLANLFPFLGGAIFQPVLGYILESQGRVGDAFTLAGYQQAFLLLFGSAVVAFLSSLCFKESMKKE